MDKIARYRGAMRGLAVCDALGTTLEFKAPGSFRPISDMVGAVNGASKEDLLADRYSPAPGYWQDHPLTEEMDDIARGSFRLKAPPEIKGTGYVVRSLEAALWAFAEGRNFREGALLAVNLGDDADTTGAVYGQLAGAFYGEEDIPAGWIESLAQRDLIDRLAGRLYARALPHGPEPTA